MSPTPAPRPSTIAFVTTVVPWATEARGRPPGVPMGSDRGLGTTDSPAAGMGMRLLTGGLGRLPGSTIGEKRRWFQERLDHLRTGLCLEPRGHRSLLIAVMTEPVTPGAS